MSNAADLVRTLHLMYLAKSEDPAVYEKAKPSAPSVKDGIEFFVVGHNASHSFYLGAKGDVLWKRAYSYDAEYDLSDEELTRLRKEEKWDELELHHKEYVDDEVYPACDNEPGYIGHW